ncbi:epithelial membrane protein 2-like [Pimephales promelas]|uniref:epithelial membrane protein 2-like n=1 Tax=Pimephales promelas TaxID=90988 RepID=UPI001955CE3B|nr:epithelial membrane protein 2-like [Pimephales promelas]KAG1933936.1 peripheral myelin protein [Pimephales promelas]KAG1933937.1 peripheral myelin protein [Pimephales promelas]
MLVLLAAIFVLHLCSITLLLAATIHNAWWMTDTVSTDIWGRWTLVGGQWNFTEIPNVNAKEYLQAVQASSVLACIFCILGLFVFVAQLYTLPKGRRFLFTGVFQLLAFLCIMIAASIYTEIFHKGEENGWYGASFILAWISVCLTFLSCVTYFILRKKTA